MKPKYNLTFGQRCTLWITWLFWVTTPEDKRKTWHEVKNGMEPHEHKFTKRVIIQGFVLYKCEHEGCNLHDDFSTK
jgi:hypothetical protein